MCVIIFPIIERLLSDLDCPLPREITLECYPKPDALNPCEDVMGSQWLRICVWVVVWLAVVGNVAVLVVLISSW